MQAIDCVDDPLELRPVQEVEDIALAGEEFLCEMPRGSRHFLGFSKRHAAFGDEAQRELDDKAKPPQAPRFVVNFRLAGSGAIYSLH